VRIMTSLNDLKVYAESSGFCTELNKLGFEQGPDNFWFFRKRGDYLDILLFWILSNKKFVTVPVDCQKFNLISHCDMTQFPKKFTQGFGQLSGYYIDEDEICGGSWPWDIRDSESATESLTDILKIFKESADTWFKSITNDELLFNSYSKAFRESESGQELKKYLNLV
jgi:hypothetical protein